MPGELVDAKRCQTHAHPDALGSLLQGIVDALDVASIEVVVVATFDTYPPGFKAHLTVHTAPLRKEVRGLGPAASHSDE